MTEPSNSNNQIVAHQRWLSPAAINLQQLHRHEAQSQATTARLMRRLDLPSYLESRYQSVGLQTQGFSARFDGQRRQVSGLGSEKMLQRFASEFGQDAVTVSDWVKPSVKGNELEAPLSDRSYKILSDHPNKIRDTPQVPTFIPESSVTPTTNPKPTVNSAPLTIQAKAESSDKTNLPSGLFRISRQPIADIAAVPITDTNTQAIASAAVLPNANTTAIEPASPTHLISATSISQPQESPASIASQTPKINTTLIQPSSRIIKPQIQAKNQTISTPIQQSSARYRSSELVLRSVTHLNDSLSKTPITEVASSQNQSQSGSITEIQPPISSTPLPQTIAQKSTALPVIKVASSPIQLKPQLPIQTQLAARTINFEPKSDSLQQMPIAATLPLQNSTTVIQRQTETPPPTETNVTTINPTTPPVANAVAGEVDIAELAEQVSRIIMRRMVIERERRGSGK